MPLGNLQCSTMLRPLTAPRRKRAYVGERERGSCLTGMLACPAEGMIALGGRARKTT